MRLIVVILSAFVALTTAGNATFYTAEEAIEDQYIIVMQPGYDTEGIRNAILEDKSGIFSGSSIKYTYTNAIIGIAAKLPKNALEKLMTREDVKYISQDGMVHGAAVGSWGLDRVNQRDLPLDGKADYSGKGTGVNVYVIDSGIYPDSVYFGGRAQVAFDALPREGAYGLDCNGHGTHCAGTIGADMFGVAPGVKLFGVRILDCRGSGPWSAAIAGVDYVAKNAVKPAVASLSWGGRSTSYTVPVDEAVQGLINTGITAVVAAQNYGEDSCYFSPARLNDAITVGATDKDDGRSSFSNYGSCVDIFAPGRDITSVGIGGREKTYTASGTSMACPHVTGAVAIQLAAYPSCPSLTPAQLKARIIQLASTNKVKNPGDRSPNRLLYVP